MTRIGPKFTTRQTVPASRPVSAPTTTDSQNAQPKDLVELNTGEPRTALKKSLQNAGTFLLKNGLPMIGAALAGPAGLAAGAVATGVIEYLDRPEDSAGKRLTAAVKRSVLTSAVTGTLGVAGMLWAPLGPILQTGTAALGTTAAGVIEYGAHAGNQDMKVDLGKFASEYKKRADKLLSEAGHPGALKQVGSGWALSDEARKFKNQVRLTQTAAVVNHLLGPGVAVALAGDIGRERVDASKLGGLADQFYTAKAVSQETVDGVEVRRIEGLAKRDNSTGMALYNLILLDADYQLGEPGADFVLGHEMSHVRHNDSGATLAQNALQEAVESITRKTGSDKERLMLAELYNDLNEAKLAGSRTAESRADREGLEFARSRGHQDQEILASALEIFGEQDSPDSYQQHPNGAKRMSGLRQEMGLKES